MKLKDAALWKESYDQLRQHIKKQRHSFANRGPYSQSYGFSSLTYMYLRAEPQRRLSAEALSTFKLWCWRSLLRVPWTVRRSNQSIIKKSVLNIHWKDWCWRWNSNTLATWSKELTRWKRPWCWERLRAGGEKGMTEDEIVGWHHWVDGHEFEYAPGVDDGQGGLACCSPWGRKVSDTAEQLN